ncbi:ATP-binding protein [Streptomyces sp. V4-01]|uniref:ATP-binding protein n=1 Tax=Actinacidiphila polyblastidii TaxID=3110430 RepID=A0ABU7PG66_9ACTN|nr:ATP-binding protein [Streptomyces sp. V4-01]
MVFEDSADYDAEPSVIGAARDFVEDFIKRGAPALTVSDRQRGAAALVTSELVTNTVRHAPGPFRLRLELSADQLVIAVTDGSAGQPVSRPPDPTRVGQHGMEIVLALCRSVHVELTAHGKTVIARLATS